ncbi:hypothetical protein ILUMI_24402 [Ignelater luminosus]|uniref:Tetraspanin n=1 Tax=Ignelater luminosus TaxID=2038154 RepID=A0A8K0FWL0_IGNLU|nr:hypothetical protein ILUMI_24402 [Ignelater luminosus]
MAVSKKCKELLCLFYTGLLFVSGILLLVCSVYFGYKLIYHFKFVSSECLAPFILIFLLAFIHILLTWLGIKGPRKEHVFHIVLFIIITVLLISAEFAIGIWSMILWKQADNKSLQLMTNSFEGFVKDDYDKSDWVKLQSQLHCCGINNESDYTTNRLSRLSGSIPISCCNSTTATSCPTIYQHGCKEPLIKYVKRIMLYIALVGFGSGLFQILGIVAFYYFHKVLKQEIAARAVVRRQSRIQEANPLNRQNSRVNGRTNSIDKKGSGSAA